MSDIFDHFMDAQESAMDYWHGTGGNTEYSNSYFNEDPLFYFNKINYKEVKAETQKAMLVDSLWIPKALIKEHKADNQTMYVHAGFLKSKIESLHK